MTNILIISGIIVVVLFAIGLIFASLYKRASKGVSYVRTGFGGEKVIMNGGGLVLPVLHEIIAVNMNTLRLLVHRANEQGLITRDRMRVDVVAEFYVRVKPTKESIAKAAQTLGSRTLRPEELKELVEGKFVDALRSVAAQMSMEDLHEQRENFVAEVQNSVARDLSQNGLELESVSLTGFDQTSMEYFNPNNAFDAEGLTLLTKEIEARKKIRNDIEQDTSVQITNKDLETEKLKIEITKEQEYARMQQHREIEIKKAEQMAEIAKETSEREMQAELAKISASQNVQKSNILSQKVIEEEQIQKERDIKIAAQSKEIAIAEKSKEQSLANAEADHARAHAVEAEEKVTTSREKEIAERRKQIELIEASQDAEREAIAIKIAAEADKNAAIDRAEAMREEAKGIADKTMISANAEAEAEKVKAAAAEIRYAVEATGNKALNEAANMLSDEQVAMNIKIKVIENLENIIRQSVEPMKRIDGIKIIQVDGLNGGASNNAGSAAAGGGNLSDQIVNSALKYRAQAPLLDSLLKDVGIDGKDINSFTNMLHDAKDSSSTESVAGSEQSSSSLDASDKSGVSNTSTSKTKNDKQYL